PTRSKPVWKPALHLSITDLRLRLSNSGEETAPFAREGSVKMRLVVRCCLGLACNSLVTPPTWGPDSASKHESSHSMWRPGHPAARRNRVSAQTHGPDRGAANPVAHHEDLRPPRVHPVRAVPGLQRGEHQGIFPQLPVEHERCDSQAWRPPADQVPY